LSNESIYLVTSGTGSNLSVSYPPDAVFGEGSVIRAKLHTNIAANATFTVDNTTGRILDSKGGGVKAGAIAGSILTLVYNGVNFILQGEGGGVDSVTGAAGDLLSGKTMNDASGANVTGTMPNNGAASSTITTQSGQYTIPAGYHNGSGKVTAALPSPANGSSGYIETGQVSSWDGALHVMPPAGYYNGNQWLRRNDQNFVAANLKNGVSILGITGMLDEGIKAIGTISLTVGSIPSWSWPGINLGFRPKICIVFARDIANAGSSGTTNTTGMVFIFSDEPIQNDKYTFTVQTRNGGCYVGVNGANLITNTGVNIWKDGGTYYGSFPPGMPSGTYIANYWAIG
jgi:hypothetical protein